MRDGLGQVTTFTYDGMSRLLQTSTGIGEISLNFYNRAVRRYSIDAMGRKTNYYYDSRMRETDRVYGNPGPGDQGLIFTCNSAGEMLRAHVPAEPLRNADYRFDHRGRHASETSAGLTHNYEYDEAGNRTGVVYGHTGRRLVSTYDALHRLQTCTESNGITPGTPAAMTSYGYDLAGRTVLKTLPNNITEAKGYDAAGRTTTQITRAGPTPGATPLSTTTSRYDAFSRLVWQKEERSAIGTGTGTLPAVLRIIENTYDRAHRLLVERVPAGGTAPAEETVYAYDKGSNRTSVTRRASAGGATLSQEVHFVGPSATESWAVEDGKADTKVTFQANQLRKVIRTGMAGEIYFRYDKTGNRIQRYHSGTGEDTRYGWDRAGRLREVTRIIRGQPAATMETWRYGYDHRTRRVYRKAPFTAAAPALVEIDSYSGGTSVSRWTAPTADPVDAVAANRTLAHETIRGSDYGGGVGGVLYTIEAPTEAGSGPAKRRFFEYGARGDVTGQRDATGTPVFRAVYQAFGEYMESGEPTGPGRQRASTKEEETALGLLNEGFRYRETATGAFLSRTRPDSSTAPTCMPMSGRIPGRGLIRKDWKC